MEGLALEESFAICHHAVVHSIRFVQLYASICADASLDFPYEAQDTRAAFRRIHGNNDAISQTKSWLHLSQRRTVRCAPSSIPAVSISCR